MKGVAISMIAMLAVVQLIMVQPGEAAFANCGAVIANLAQCTEHLIHGGDVSPACCAGVQKLKDQAVTTTDKQFACQCVQDAAKADTRLNEDYAKDIPTKCNIEMNIPISRTTKCSEIKF